MGMLLKSTDSPHVVNGLFDAMTKCTGFVVAINHNLNVIFSFCREINGEKKNFCLVTNPRKKLKYRMFAKAES